MTRVRIFQSYFETDPHGVSQELFQAGQVYELNPATQRQIERRNGELVEEPVPAAANSPEPSTRARQRIRSADQ
jgi:hypothetical protein